MWRRRISLRTAASGRMLSAKFPGQCLRHLPELVCNGTRVQKSFAGDAWREFQNPVHLLSWRRPRVPRLHWHHRREQRIVCQSRFEVDPARSFTFPMGPRFEPVRSPLLKLRAIHSPNPELRKSLILGGTSAWKSKKSEKSKMSDRLTFEFAVKVRKSTIRELQASRREQLVQLAHKTYEPAREKALPGPEVSLWEVSLDRYRQTRISSVLDFLTRCRLLVTYECVREFLFDQSN